MIPRFSVWRDEQHRHLHRSIVSFTVSQWTFNTLEAPRMIRRLRSTDVTVISKFNASRGMGEATSFSY